MSSAAPSRARATDAGQAHQRGLRAFGLRAAPRGALGLLGGDHAVLVQPLQQQVPGHRPLVARCQGFERRGAGVFFIFQGP
jgi:hypothetical protein